MTTHYSALTVVLEKDIGPEALEQLQQAILLLRGVASVQGHEADIVIAKMVAETRIKRELWDKMVEVLR